MTSEGWCRRCRQEYDRLYYAANRDRIIKRRKGARLRSKLGMDPTQLDAVIEQLTKVRALLAATQSQAATAERK